MSAIKVVKEVWISLKRTSFWVRVTNSMSDAQWYTNEFLKMTKTILLVIILNKVTFKVIGIT